MFLCGKVLVPYSLWHTFPLSLSLSFCLYFLFLPPGLSPNVNGSVFLTRVEWTSKSSMTGFFPFYNFTSFFFPCGMLSADAEYAAQHSTVYNERMMHSYAIWWGHETRVIPGSGERSVFWLNSILRERSIHVVFRGNGMCPELVFQYFLITLFALFFFFFFFSFSSHFHFLIFLAFGCVCHVIYVVMGKTKRLSSPNICGRLLIYLRFIAFFFFISLR